MKEKKHKTKENIKELGKKDRRERISNKKGRNTIRRRTNKKEN
jgi:hypothetical protein